MRRWGQITEAKSDAWYLETAKAVYRPDIYTKAAELVIADGFAKAEDFPAGTDGFKAPTADFIDGITYDGRKPNDYLAAMAIGLKAGEVVEGTEVLTK